MALQLKAIVTTPLHTLNWIITLIQLKAHCKSNCTLRALWNCKMLTLPTIHFKLCSIQNMTTREISPSLQNGQTRAECNYLLQTNRSSGAEAICKHSSVSPEVASFKFHYNTTLELLCYLSTNIVHKSEPRYASTALYLRPSLPESTAGWRKFEACSTAEEWCEPGIEDVHSWGAEQIIK